MNAKEYHLLNWHLDGEISIPTIRRDATTLLIFWWRKIPLGQMYLRPENFPQSASELISLVQTRVSDTYLKYSKLLLNKNLNEDSLFKSNNISTAGKGIQQLRDQLNAFAKLGIASAEEPESSSFKVSVILATCQRPKKLFACLTSLQALKLKPYEIIVVDNSAGDPATREVVQQFPAVRYLSEKKRGSSAARNTGVRQSKGHLIAFVDDDEVVHPNWLSHLVNCFTEKSTGLATGLVLPGDLQNEIQYMFEKRFSFVRGYTPFTFDSAYYQEHRKTGVPVWDIGGSGNMAIRKSVFNAIGGFDERLGAGQAGCSEDSALFYAALANGWECQYEPRAVVFHTHRSDIESLSSQLHFYMRGHVTALLFQFKRYRDFGNLFRLFVVLPLVYLKNIIRIFSGDPAFQSRLIRSEISGCFSGINFYFQNRSTHGGK